jgi:hypothetical protein
MAKVFSIKDFKRSRRGRTRRLENIKEELLRYHGIDLDELMANEPASSLSMEQFDELSDVILASIDEFCETHQQITIHDLLYALENVKEIIRENAKE